MKILTCCNECVVKLNTSFTIELIRKFCIPIFIGIRNNTWDICAKHVQLLQFVKIAKFLNDL